MISEISVGKWESGQIAVFIVIQTFFCAHGQKGKVGKWA